MSNINLLPWRAELKELQRKQFFTLLGACALISVLLCIGVNLLFGQAVSQQQARNQFLSNEMALLDQQIGEVNKIRSRRNELIERIRLIDRLQQSRNLTVHLFNDLPVVVTNGVYLDSLEFSGDKVSMVGKTEAHSRVASMMRLIDRSGWLGQTSISSIFASQSEPLAISEFAVQFRVLGDEQTASQEQGAAP